ncbi:MAG: hypothetical protein N2117_15740 [Anaerolineales bacterium]|nr:hypothetical protein [Anaerolineales bacterium]MCX7756679.1 hypothetical protein [Anaerolineales bacterium]MDW8279258.1 hypothetical protein [Anaerolineales bacterium]
MKTYLIAGLAVFIFLVVMGLMLEFSLGETLVASLVLSVVGMLVVWWQHWFG